MGRERTVLLFLAAAAVIVLAWASFGRSDGFNESAAVPTVQSPLDAIATVDAGKSKAPGRPSDRKPIDDCKTAGANVAEAQADLEHKKRTGASTKSAASALEAALRSQSAACR